MTRGVLLVNLGSPEAPTEGAVRTYLRQFLMDARVIDAPWLIRKAIVELTILPKRPKDSAHAYQQVWTEAGSPLVVTSYQLRDAVRKQVDLPVSLGMRYGNPSIRAGLEELLTQNVSEILLVPLYPHYAMSSFETVVVECEKQLKKLGNQAALVVYPPCYDQADYISALADSAQKHLAQGYDHLLFSYHGIPERHLRKSDPSGRHCLQPNCCQQASGDVLATCYKAQCLRTTKAFVQHCNIAEDTYSISFQSRLGKDPWLKPYTDHVIDDLARQGVKHLAVMCPAFVSDCLETIEEIGMTARESFIKNGGEEFTLVPCMNVHPSWVRVLAGWCTYQVAVPQAVAS